MSATSLQRAVECTLAAILAVLTLPLLLAAAVSSALVYRASPFFVHDRVGRHGETFRFAKIRTLPPSTCRYADKYSIADIGLPRSMQFVRRTHLDELPQLWAVLTGRLSLVGPRPEMAVLHEQIPPDAAAERLSVRPGITGLWQVSVHCEGLICDRIEYDRLYVRHRNPLLDLWILWSTVRKMVLGRRIQLFEVPRWAIGSGTPATAPAPAPAPAPDPAPAPAPAMVLVEKAPSEHDPVLNRA